MESNDFSHALLLDHLHDGVYFVNMDQVVTFWNRGAERITGYTRGDVVGKICDAHFLGHTDEDGQPAFGSSHPAAICLRTGEAQEAELFLKNKEGRLVPVVTRVSPILNSLQEPIGALEVFSDNSSKMQAMQRIEELEAVALICPLTSAGNRRYAEMALKDAVDEFQRYGWPFGVLFVDIDHFKRVNDDYGHNVGDEVLCMVAHALRSSLRSIDFVGRWGGEEFLVILPNTADDIIGVIAERCRRSVEESCYQTQGKEIRVTISIGAALSTPDETMEQLVERADRFMYRSKAEGRNRVTLDE